MDPTENVKALTEAANVRQDDLREEIVRRIDAELACIKEVAGLRAEHAKEIRELESRRLDAIRQVDVLAVGRTAEQQLAAVQTLAATTTSTAENIRASVTSTAAALATQLANTVTGLTERIQSLEKTSYTGAGKEAVADPALAELIREVRGLRTGRATDAGKGEQSKDTRATIIAAVSIGIAALALIARFL